MSQPSRASFRSASLLAAAMIAGSLVATAPVMGAGSADGDPVASWPDASGACNHATQATAAKRPALRAAQVAGMPAVTFDAVVKVATPVANCAAVAGGASGVAAITSISPTSGSSNSTPVRAGFVV